MLNTDLVAVYGIDVKKPQRDKLNRLRLLHSVRSGRTFLHDLDDRGWLRVQDPLPLSNPKARVSSGALIALHENLRGRLLGRSDCQNLGEMFSRSAITPVRRPGDLEVRLRGAYAALASEPGGWVTLTRLRQFFTDVVTADLDAALIRLSRAGDANFVPESNQKMLTDADWAASVRIGGQDKHLLAISA